MIYHRCTCWSGDSKSMFLSDTVATFTQALAVSLALHFFCFSYPKLRPWHLFIDPKSTQLRWMSSLSTQLWRTTSPSCRVAGLPPGYGCRPPTTATLEGGGVDIIVDMPLDRTYPCRLCVFLCVVATCLVCSCRPCFNACIRVQQHHVKNNTIAPQPYIYISK